MGVILQEHTEEQVNEYLAELAFLAETAGAIAIKVFKQRLPHPDSKTFVGKGKLEEIKQYVAAKDIDVVIFDDELTGSQKNLDPTVPNQVQNNKMTNLNPINYTNSLNGFI